MILMRFGKQEVKNKDEIRNGKCPDCGGQLYEGAGDDVSFITFCDKCHLEFWIELGSTAFYRLGKCSKEKMLFSYKTIPSVKELIVLKKK